MSGKITVSVIKADVGGCVGHSSLHPDLLKTAEDRLGLDDMEYTTMPQLMKKLEGRFVPE